MSEAFSSGYWAYVGRWKKFNPYWVEGGRQWSQWNAGWDRAKREAAERAGKSKAN